MGYLDKLLRRSKGPVPIPSPKSEYVVFDLETTGLSRYYSEIIQISAIKVANGQPVDYFNTYIKPRRGIPSEATAINHITEDMVEDAPSFKEAFANFRDFVKDDVLIGYNILGFDLPLLNNQSYLNGGSRFNTKYIDILPIAKKVLSLSDYRLTTVANYIGLDTRGAHDALFDCDLTNECFSALRPKGAKEDVQLFEGKPFPFRVQLNEQSIAINVLRSILLDISNDGQLDENEFFELTNWISVNRSLEGSYPFDVISQSIDDILSDGVIETSELDLLEGLIEEWLDPVMYSYHDPLRTLEGKHIVITGDFDFGGVDDVTSYIVGKGAIVDDRVTKKTDYIVVGALGSKAWVAGNYGNKIKKALEYRAKGQNIQIIREYDFLNESSVL